MACFSSAYTAPLRLLCCALLGILLSTPALADRIQARVVRVSDGDTVVISTGPNRKNERVRLYGIDAPETKQPYGAESKSYLQRRIHSQLVTVEFNERDHYGRIVGRIFFNGKDINLEMIQQGWAWCYRQYCKDPAYARAEEAAKQARIGIWRSSAPPTPPWEFRRQKRNKR